MGNSGSDNEVDGAEPELTRLEPATTAVVRGVVPLADLRNFFDTSFGALGRTIGAQGITPLSPAFGLYRGSPGDALDLEVGFVTDREVRPEAGVVAGTLPGGRVARVTHHGSFDGLGASWERLHAWMRAQGLPTGDARWETYVTQPTPDMDPGELRTVLNWPVAD
ncbi:GyrI-like domain-containing protein [Streptomyces longispororuber]|uniref:GyrI-like domain-containing protein n=1 Tax=Streptomyces longispororuber TaxID=68230 RepID=UPI0021090355|nr:GyrI-like domain-containing protein [Streptomyces longispororuber]MCQ4207425.1 GyrI-like domain-containing protein [Streptomyces longispororuber]